MILLSRVMWDLWVNRPHSVKSALLSHQLWQIVMGKGEVKLFLLLLFLKNQLLTGLMIVVHFKDKGFLQNSLISFNPANVSNSEEGYLVVVGVPCCYYNKSSPSRRVNRERQGFSLSECCWAMAYVLDCSNTKIFIISNLLIGPACAKVQYLDCVSLLIWDFMGFNRRHVLQS